MLNQCIFRWTNTIPTACIGLNGAGNPVLMINKEFFSNLSEQHRVGLLQHEILHLAQGHLFRGKDLNHQVANQAMDIAINQYINSDYLPTGGLMPAMFNLPTGKSFEYYYVELMKNAPNPNSPMDQHNWEELLDKVGESTDGLSEDMQKQAAKNIIEVAVKEAEATIPRCTPISVLEAIKTEYNPSKTSWKTLLRRYVGKHYSEEREASRSRPNRRMGLMSPGSKRMDAPKLMIAIDQSGSVSNEMISQFMNEIHWMLNSVKDKVEVVYFDTKIHHSVTLDKLSDVNKQRYANGGTNFDCIVDYANNKRPDLVIILTDGEADAPKEHKFPILWGIVGELKITEHLKGRVIRI